MQTPRVPESSAAEDSPLLYGVHSRGYLPHFKRPGVSYFITFLLADSLPAEVLVELRRKHGQFPGRTGSEAAQLEYRRSIERYLDRGAGACHLKRPEIARVVAEALLCLHEVQYVLDEWVIMPNHVHVILRPLPGYTLSGILRGRKGVTSRQANLLLKRSGQPFWQHESYDHWVRSEEEMMRIRRYIRNNPVKAGLCKYPGEWPWCRAGWTATPASAGKSPPTEQLLDD